MRLPIGGWRVILPALCVLACLLAVGSGTLRAAPDDGGVQIVAGCATMSQAVVFALQQPDPSAGPTVGAPPSAALDLT
ncbi:MAG: hypothetical protein ACYDCQ_04415, partial [Dehalococcoidia bacterium]